MNGCAPIRLHFEDSGEWYSLPDWAEYFMAIGRQAARAERTESRIVTAIVVPTRAFGAAFVSLGMVIGDAAERGQVSQAAHFAALLNLPAGSPVIYRRNLKQTFKGILQGWEEVSGERYVRVQVTSSHGGRQTFLVPESTALQVQPGHHSGVLPKTQSGKNSRFANNFVDYLLGDSNAVQLGMCPNLCCAIVGKKDALEHEIRKTPLAIHANGNSRRGTFRTY